MASWARRSLAAETIFMAFVICCVLLTLRIRRRMSMRAGISPRKGQWSGGPGDALEDGAELRERGLDAVGQLSLDVLLLHDPLEEGGVAGLQEGVQLLLVAPAFGDRDLVQVAVGGGEDDGDLLFHGERLVLVLLEDLGGALAAGEGRPGRLVEVGAELGEGGELAELGEV